KGHLAGNLKPFHVVRMHSSSRHLVSGNIENFLRARIPQERAVVWIVVPPAELGRVEGKLQTRVARVQGLLRLLARVNILNHGYVAQRAAGPVANDVGRHARPYRASVVADASLL